MIKNENLIAYVSCLQMENLWILKSHFILKDRRASEKLWIVCVSRFARISCLSFSILGILFAAVNIDY